MSEEEKKAIEYWKRDIELYHCNTQLASEHYTQIVLNLIEKQQKELEQEKEKNKKFEKHLKQYLDGELITAMQGKFFEKMIKENYIRKDKIKEKIEEIENECDLCRYKGELCEQLCKNNQCVPNSTKNILEELLKERR